MTAKKGPAEHMVTTMTGTALLTFVRVLMDRGLPGHMAIRLAAAAMLEEAFGPKILDDLGIPDRTQRNWRADIREAIGSAPLPETPPASLVNDLLRAAGLPLKVVDE